MNLTFQCPEDQRERQSLFSAGPEVERRLRTRFLGGRPSTAPLTCRLLLTAATAAVVDGFIRPAGVVVGRRRHVTHGGEHAGRVRQDPVSVDARFDVEHGRDVLPVVGRVVLKNQQPPASTPWRPQHITFGPLNMAGFQFLNELERRISQESGDFRESAFLFQRLSMTIQPFNTVAIQGTFAMRTPTEYDV